MFMEKGLAIIEVNDTETKGFYIDQDALEFSRLNAKTKQRVDDAEKRKQNTEQCNNRAEKANAQRKAFILKTLCRILFNTAVCGGVAWAGAVGMVHPIISIPVSVLCLCAACVRLGAWIGSSK